MERGVEATGPIAPEQRAAVEALLARRELAPRQRERLEMVKAAWLGEDVATIARWSGRTARTVRRWLQTFREGGVHALAGEPIPGRPPKADAAYLTALEAAVETPPRALGLPFDIWSSRRLSAYLDEQTGVRRGMSLAQGHVGTRVPEASRACYANRTGRGGPCFPLPATPSVFDRVL